MSTIDHFEALVEQLVEGTFGRLFPPPLQSGELARCLSGAIEVGRRVEGDDVVLPNRYRVFLNPSDYAALRTDEPMRQDDLGRCLSRVAREAGGRFAGGLIITFHPSPGLPVGRIEVQADHAPCQAMDAVKTRETAVAKYQAAAARQWALRLGACTYQLGEPVVHIGRALSCEIIIDNQRVSRRHARLRWREGRYHLSDPGGGGVYLNGRALPVGSEQPLTQGDQIGLAELVLIVEQPCTAAVDPAGLS